MTTAETREYRQSLPRLGILDEVAANGLRDLLTGFQKIHGTPPAPTQTEAKAVDQRPLQARPVATDTKFVLGEIRHPSTIKKGELERISAIARLLAEEEVDGEEADDEEDGEEGGEAGGVEADAGASES
jgi:hypothetical protein